MAPSDPVKRVTGERVLVTGGAGFLGINLVRYLLERGAAVTSLDLAAFDYPDVQARVRRSRATSATRPPSTRDGGLRGCVVHAAAALPLYTPRGHPHHRRRRHAQRAGGGARHGRRRGWSTSRPPRSTASPTTTRCSRTTSCTASAPYGEAKIEAEELCGEYRARGLCVPILRPKSFVGPERLGVFALLYDWAHDGRNFPIIGSGNNRYQLLDVEDLCEAIYLCRHAATRDGERHVQHRRGASSRTMREDFQAVLDRAGFGKRIVPLPAAPAIWTLRVLERLKLSPLYKWVYETASKDSFVSIEKAAARARLRAAVLEQRRAGAQLRLVRRAPRPVRATASGVSHRVPWKQGVAGHRQGVLLAPPLEARP